MTTIEMNDNERKPYVCPVCGGRGIVVPGFYNANDTTTISIPEFCRSCGGTGVVWG